MTSGPRVFTLRELAERLGAEVHGDPECVINKVSSFNGARPGCITFLSDPEYQQFLSSTQASAVIVNKANADALQINGLNGLIVENPHVAFAQVADCLCPVEKNPPGIHPQASIDPASDVHADAWVGPQCVIEAGAVIGADCHIGPGCVIGKNVVIGEACRLIANVTICHGSRLGANVIVHPGAVLGADGFGLAKDQDRWLKVPQVGRVIIGNDVEIGANTTIDRGAIDDTIIGDGVKLDNLIQIAHNVHVGEHTAIAACTGIAGSTRIGKHCAIGGAVGIVGHLEIADNVTITFMSCVTQSILQAGVYSSGAPLEENAKWHRNFVRMKQLDEMARKIKALEKAIKKSGVDGNSGQA